MAPSSDPFHRLGESFYNAGKVTQAISLSREATEVLPGDANAHCSLGRGLLDFGETDSAVAEIREALRFQ
jgi:Flp pilus assembly protein TadD